MDYQISAEEVAWETTHPDDLWVMDKLILSRKLGYVCGPAGTLVPAHGDYIVRPCVNAMGLGLGARKTFLVNTTDKLELGTFWCEWFKGRHLSVDFHYGNQVLCVEGIRPDIYTNNLSKWGRWVRTDDQFEFPSILKTLRKSYEWINCEFIGDKLIEVHLRKNEDFSKGTNIQEFVPVWEGERTDPEEGWRYIEYPDLHGRIGAFIKEDYS